MIIITLEILNGMMTPEFDENIYEYDIYLDSNEENVLFNYITQGVVTIYGNDYITEGESHIILEHYDEKLITYTFNVYKEETKNVFSKVESIETVKENKINLTYADIIIVFTTIILIFFLFIIIFKRKQKLFSLQSH